jgi:hypothetical protein
MSNTHIRNNYVFYNMSEEIGRDEKKEAEELENNDHDESE